MIQIYGSPRSRAHRVLWMLEELGLQYENITETHGEDGRPIEALAALNPNGKIPTLVDGDTVVWESLAINLDLASRYDGGMQPRSASDQTQALQWSFWVATELESPLFDVLRNRVVYPEDQRDLTAAAAAEASLARPLAALDSALADRPFILDGAFSVADLNVASVLALGTAANVSLEDFTNVARWLHDCTSRPAAVDVLGRAMRDAGL